MKKTREREKERERERERVEVYCIIAYAHIFGLVPVIQRPLLYFHYCTENYKLEQQSYMTGAKRSK